MRFVPALDSTVAAIDDLNCCPGGNVRLRTGMVAAPAAIVRDGNALGCPGWAGVSVGTQSEIDFFLQELAALEVGARRDVQGR